MNDPVNNPKHYTEHPSGVECIEITRHMNFNLGNAMKYIWRADLKQNRTQDLEKAIWYLQDELKRTAPAPQEAGDGWVPCQGVSTSPVPKGTPVHIRTVEGEAYACCWAEDINWAEVHAYKVGS